MKIAPKQENELKPRFGLLPNGTYPFTVLASDEIASKSAKNSGKMMFAVKLNVHGPDADHHVFSYFSDWFNEFQLRHFAATTGQLKDYESGNFDGTNGKFQGKTGYVKIKTEAGKGNFGPKNAVDDYVVRDAKPVEQPNPEPKESDDVPF